MDRIIITSSYSFLKNFKLDECDLVWSLHPAVDKYCADNKFRFISILHDEPITNRKALFKYTNSLTDNTLSYLDRKYAEKISKILELPNFPIFKTIYSYRLKYTISILHLLFKKLKSVRPNSTIYFLDPSSFTLIPNNVLSKFFQEYCSSNIIHCLDLPTNFLNLIYKRIKSYRQLFIKFYKQLKFTLNSRSKKIFLLSSAYDFESMLDQFEDFPFQFIKNNSLKNNEISFTRAGSLIPLSESINNEDKLFEDLIIDLFLDEYSFIKNSILNCKKFLQTSEVDVVVWGNPPCLNSGMAVTARYLMESGIPVVGYQHGGSYGIQEMLVGHHDSDYQHCTHFFSYGFTAEDVYETTGDYPNCEIIPVGSLKVSSSVQRTKTNSLSKERIDVLYITTNQIPYLMRDSFSYQLPKSIIDLLGSQVNMKSVVKLFPGASKFNYSHYEYSKSFQNLLVYSRGGVFDILRKFDPLLIIMCYPSTPLYEVLDSKASIFLLNDPLSPFSASSKSLLEQRVHLFDTFEQLKTSFELFRLNQLNFKGGLEFSKKFAQSYPLFEHVSLLSGQLKSISDQRFI